jgi:hypothetical protein
MIIIAIVASIFLPTEATAESRNCGMKTGEGWSYRGDVFNEQL